LVVHETTEVLWTHGAKLHEHQPREDRCQDKEGNQDTQLEVTNLHVDVLDQQLLSKLEVIAKWKGLNGSLRSLPSQ